MRAIVARAYAKINLLLNVTGKRPDGYHELDGVMIPVDIFDTLRAEKSPEISVVFDRFDLPPQDNSAAKAASLFFRTTGIKGGADIFIRKRIPVEAGLGGGSSDAACVLLALDKLYETNLKLDALNALAASLGADVPFFLEPGAKRARGIGEILDAIEYNFNAAFLIVKPYGGVNTATAFRAFYGTVPAAADTGECMRALKESDLPLFSRNAKNMLQDASVKLLPEIQNALDALYQNGALFALMTGSGSAVYGNL